MNHDVFISYSSKRSEVANEICALLENSGLKCWIAPRDIVGNNYDDLIDEAIVGCKLFVFVFSQESSVSTWCKAELNLAFSENKAILPYRIDNTPLRGGFRLKLQMSHWLDASLDYRSEFPKLVHMATQIVGVSSSQPTPEPQQPKPESKPQPKLQPTTKTYKVGDLYDDGTRKGVVFEVTPDGKHGKIVSLEQTRQRWSNEYEWTGATSRTDGMANMRAIQTIGGWRKKYPAFDWCADMGDGCYLPAIEELRQYTLNKDIRMKVNQSLSQYNECIQDYCFYWSSTEYNNFCAEGVDRGYGDVDTGGKDNWSGYVRYVAKF